MSVRFALLGLALLVSGCGIYAAHQADLRDPICITVVSPFVEDPIVIPPNLNGNIQLCAPKGGFYRVTEECVPLFVVRQYLYAHAADRAER